MPSTSAQELANLLLKKQDDVIDDELRQTIRLFQETSKEEDLIYLILVLLKRIRELEGKSSDNSVSPSTPSGMIPPYEKPNTHSTDKKRGKIGRKKGHKGARRSKPERINKQVEHRLKCCPDCGGPLQQCNGKQSVRTRIIEEIPEEIEPEVTEHIIHRDYCPRCKKSVEAPVEEALPRAAIGNRLLVLAAFWHFAVGMTLSQILETLNFHLHFPLSKGGLIKQWHRLRIILFIWYESLAAEIQESAVLHADETGWRVDGDSHWLWCFTTNQATFYMVDRSRGGPALKKVFQESFDGILVTDFWRAYDAVAAREHQCCLFHLLNELHKVSQKNTSEEWTEFSKKTKRLIQDALRLRAREDFSPERYQSRIDRLYERLLILALGNYTDNDTRRIAGRLEKYRDELFVFLQYPDVPSDNNHAEREIRTAVLMRKVIYGNRSQDGALTQSVLMTVFRTLKRRGYNPIDTIISALRDYIRTGQRPPFPPARTSD